MGWRRERAVLGVNVGHPIVTNGDCGIVIPKLLSDFLFNSLSKDMHTENPISL